MNNRSTRLLQKTNESINKLGGPEKKVTKKTARNNRRNKAMHNSIVPTSKQLDAKRVEHSEKDLNCISN